MIRRTWDFVRVAAVATTGAATGAVLSYFLDPDRGRSRRARASDQAPAALRRASRKLSRRARYLAGRARGVALRARGAGRPSPHDDLQVAEQIRQGLARLSFSTADVTVEVVRGVARLRGQVATEQEQRMVEDKVLRAAGVREVHSFLHLPGTPAPNKSSALRAS